MLHRKAVVEGKWVCETGCGSLLERREERSSGSPKGPRDLYNIFRMGTLTYIGSRRKGTPWRENEDIGETKVPRLDGEMSFREKEEDEESSSEPRRKHMTTDRYKHLTYVEGVSHGLESSTPSGLG